MHNNETQFEAFYNECQDFYNSASSGYNKLKKLLLEFENDSPQWVEIMILIKRAAEDCNFAIEKQLELISEEEWNELQAQLRLIDLTND